MAAAQSPQFKFKVGPIKPEDYLRLIKDLGWSRFVNPESVKVALENTLWSAVTIDVPRDLVIGCVRIIGDGNIFYYIQNLMVMKEYRKKELGKGLKELANSFS